MMQRTGLGAVVALVLAGHPVQAADIGLRPDLRPRLEQLLPIYGDWNNSFEYGPIVQPGQEYWKGLRIIGISGRIEDGDAQRLADVLGPEEETGAIVVVFNSPGGSFVEGVRIGQVLEPLRGGNGDPALNGVVVLAGEQCNSACAVAFALAAMPRDSGHSVRFVEVGAQLGFHMPFVPVDQQAVRTEIAQAMDLTYQIMSEYMRLIGNGIAPTALVQNALHYRRPDEFFMLRGGLVTRFMDFVPVAGPRGATPITLSGLTERDALNMCQYLTYSRGRMMTADDYEWWPENASGAVEAGTPLTDLFRKFGADRLALDGCMIERLDGDTLGIDSSGDCERDFIGGGWCAKPRGAFDKPLPPASGALLADSLGCHMGQLTRAYYPWDWRNSFLEEEEPDSYRWSGGNDPDKPRTVLDWGGAQLEANLNIRTAPGGDRVARWNAGTPVQVLDCTLSADGQGIWYQVSSGGVTGWASARYVDVPALRNWNGVIRPAGVE